MATLSNMSLSLGELLAYLRRTSRIKPLLLEALAEKMIRQAAQEAGLAVSKEELQQAANRFRQQRGLRTAEDTQAWLRQNGMRLIDLEARVEQTLLVDKFRHHLTDRRLQDRFRAEAARYARVRISHFTVAAEGLARELLVRIQDEGADFVDLARQHAQPGSAVCGSGVVAMRADLANATADVVFQARPDSGAGPVQGTQGWQLFHVHELLPPQLDEPTMARIRQELFDGWLREQLAPVQIDLSKLDQL
jgi:parvulin-like peptidyl-prolyl isomerase